MPNKDTLIDAFVSAFPSSDLAYGVYDLTQAELVESSKGTKTRGKALTKNGKYTSKQWRAHLMGEIGLGLIPITGEGTCKWGAIDIDQYNMGKDGLDRLLDQLDGIPVLPTLSKSGGVHLYVFFDRPIKATATRKLLTAIAKAVGFGGPGTELFPKQTRIDPKSGDKGNWINMPYYGAMSGKEPSRVGVSRDGSLLTAEQYLAEIERLKFDPSKYKLPAIAENTLKDHVYIPEGPPCLQYLTMNGFPKGSLNNALFNMGVYYRRSDPDNWVKRIEEANRKWMTPGTTEEVTNIVKSLKKKGYEYLCKQDPICAHCDRKTCLTRRFGVIGKSVDLPVIGGLTKLNSKPPVYYVEVDGSRIGPLDSAHLINSIDFRKAVFEALDQLIPKIKDDIWTPLVQDLLEEVVVIKLPSDSGPEGQLFELLEDFVTGPFRCNYKEGLLKGNVFEAGDGELWFLMRDFTDHLSRKKFHDLKSQKIAALFSQSGMQTAQRKIGKRNLHVWIVKGYDLVKTLLEPGQADIGESL